MVRLTLLLLLLPLPALADSISFGTTDLLYVTVTRVDANRIYFKTGGTETSRELATVARLALSDEPALLTAENAAAAGNSDAAADNYLRTLRGTQKPWLRAYIAPRLATSAAKARRFDIAAAAHVLLLTTDPALAESTKPKLNPPPRPGEIAAAIETVQLATTKTPDSPPLLKFLAELQRAAGDPNAAAATLSKAAERDPTLAPAAATARLTAAEADITRGDYLTAIQSLTESASTFTSPKGQAEALYLLAFARESQARALRSQPALQDAAIAYVRLITHFRHDLNATARVETALLRAATLLEELKQPAEAHNLYRELASSKDPENSRTARQGLARTSG